MTDLTNKTVEELREIINTRRCGDTFECQELAFDEMKRRLEVSEEEKQILLKTLAYPEHQAAFENLHLKRRLEEAQQKIVAQQAAVVALYEALSFYADPGTWFAVMLVPDHPAGEIMEDFSETELNEKPGALARRICEKYEDQSIEELSAHDAEVAAKALEDFEDDYSKTFCSDFDCRMRMRKTASEYRAKAWRKE